MDFSSTANHFSTIAVIPARGNSRRIPHKNRKQFYNVPIIEYSIRAAQASLLFHRVVVSTDEWEIAQIAWGCGASIQVRPPYLADDEVGTQDVMRYVLQGQSLEGYACCIYATAPMMIPDDLKRAREWLSLTDGLGYAHIPGWFYFARVRTFLEGVPIEKSAPMTAPKNRYIDINTPDDWARAESMYAAWRMEKA